MEKATKNVEKAPKSTTAAKPVKKASGQQSAPLSHAVGRRKSAVARVWLKRGKGALLINEKEYTKYFDTELARLAAYAPFRVYPQASSYDVQVNVNGGGLSAQADAVKLGIARAFVEINPELRSVLRQNGLLTVDSRLKERKKYGQKAARRKFQFVKR
jgi:small subunit ribosomal protein S9